MDFSEVVHDSCGEEKITNEMWLSFAFTEESAHGDRRGLLEQSFI